MANRVASLAGSERPRPAHDRRAPPVGPAGDRPVRPRHDWLLHLQRTAGNAAIRALLNRAEEDPPPTVSRCGEEHSDCGCSESDRLEGLRQVKVQRDPLTDMYLGSGSDPFGLLRPKPETLTFTNRIFTKESLPTVCPRCHRDPTIPMFPKYVDREATTDRLVSWGMESQKLLQHRGSIRVLQLDPDGASALVDDYGVGLIKRITSSHEFKGSDKVREQGAEKIRQNWPEIRLTVYNDLVSWYKGELFTAVGMTPKYASPVLQPERLRSVLTTHHGGRAPLGRWGAEAAPGQKYGIFQIVDIGNGHIWFHLPDRPSWIYEITTFDFIKHDPFVAAVAEQVYDRTKWVRELTPLLLKAGAFGLAFSGNIAFVIAGIALDELAEEMKADAEGRPGRTPAEILGSAGMQLLIDRIFHGLLGGSAGKAVAVTGKAAAKIEKITEKSVPAIRRELVTMEQPLVKRALDQGTARPVTDAALKAEGYVVEVAVETAGQRHLYRMTRKGSWCRFSATVCELDLGAEVAAAAKSPASFTKAKLEDARSMIGTIENEIQFLDKVYERMRAAGKVDVSLLSPAERVLLNDLAPSGDAAKLTLRELRDLPRSLNLKKDLRGAIELEAKLVQQLYREGRPLYEIMRAASPSYAARSRVLAEAGNRDAASRMVPRSGTLEVDHVVPLNDIVQMEGFSKLRPERQLAIVNDVKNLRAIDSLANRSRGDQSWWFWKNGAIHYDAAVIARMRALEDELRAYLEARIRALLRS